MIETLAPYPAYRASGIPWVDVAPDHWNTRRLRHVCDLRVSNVDKHVTPGEIPVRVCNYVHAYKNERITARLGLSAGTVRPAELLRFRIYPGDVLITKDSETWTDIGVPSLVQLDAPDLVCGYHLAILRPRLGMVGAYLHRALQTPSIARQLHAEASGVTRFGLTLGAINAITLPLPPPDEQAAIVRFLDWATRRIDRAIRAKRKLVSLVTEQKQAVIHRAVTRGLDPHAPMKDSGIPWLGEIPAHWQVRRLGSLFRERGEQNARGDITEVLSLLRGRGVIPYADKGNIGNKKSEDITRYKIVRPDDIVLNCMNIIIGSVGLSKYTGCLSPVYYVLVRNNGADSPHYLNAVFQCSRFHKSLIRIGKGILAHRMRIPMELLKCELLPYPPSAEQEKIISALTEATRDLDATITRTQRQIDLLREYRARLVADVVTGKLDVRAAAAALPDEAPDDGEPLAPDDDDAADDDVDATDAPDEG